MNKNSYNESKNAAKNKNANKEAAALIKSIDKSLENFTNEAIKAGREYSNYTMNQCIAVSVSGTSLFGEMKTIIIFAAFAYIALILRSISKKFPKKRT